MSELALRLWQSLTSDEAARAAGGDPVMVLPVSAIEQHGPHLPLSTDYDIGAGLLEAALAQLPKEFAAWVLPAQVVGTSVEHTSFAGTLSLAPEHLTQVVCDLGVSLAAAGVRRLVLANSHGGNRHALDAAGLWLRRHHGMLVVEASYFRFERPDEPELDAAEWRHGLHGGALETAMMMYLHPERVRRNHIGDFRSLGLELESTLRRLGPEGSARFSWLAEDLNTAGAAGDARKASAALGERLVQHYARILSEVILDAGEFPLERLSTLGGEVSETPKDRGRPGS